MSSKLKAGTKVRWSGDGQVWTIVQWQPNNGPDGAYWIIRNSRSQRPGIHGVAGEDEVQEIKEAAN